jgi:hypothetical protein
MSVDIFLYLLLFSAIYFPDTGGADCSGTLAPIRPEWVALIGPE